MSSLLGTCDSITIWHYSQVSWRMQFAYWLFFRGVDPSLHKTNSNFWDEGGLQIRKWRRAVSQHGNCFPLTILRQCLWLSCSLLLLLLYIFFYFFSTFTIPNSVATFLLLARPYCYRSLVVFVQDQNWYHTRFLFDTTKSLVIRNRRIRHADCKIANLASVQTNRGSARVLGTRGDSCCLFCVEHLVSIHWQGEKEHFLAPSPNALFLSFS